MANSTELDRLAAAQREDAARKAAPAAANPFAPKHELVAPNDDRRLAEAIQTASLMLLTFDADRRETFVRALGALLPRREDPFDALAELGSRFLANVEEDRAEQRADRARYTVGGPAAGVRGPVDDEHEPPKS